MSESAAWRVVSRGVLFTLAVLISLWLIGQLTSVIVRVVLAVILAAGMKPLVDRRFRKYPALPVLECDGFEPATRPLQ